MTLRIATFMAMERMLPVCLNKSRRIECSQGTIGGSLYGVAKNATLIDVRVFGLVESTTTETLIVAFKWYLLCTI
jgi:hypothetical protein